MDQLASQFAVVNAILAGFAFTFIGGLLSAPQNSRSYTATFAANLIAAVALMVASVGSVFVALRIAGKFVSAAQVASLHALASQAFLLGLCSFLVAVACVGWIKSKLLGRISTGAALGGFLALLAVVVPFLRTQ